MSVAPVGKLTVADFQRFPEDDGLRHELVEGRHVVSPSPLVAHQRVAAQLFGRLFVYWQRRPEIGEFFFAPFDVYLDLHNVFEPDILFVSAARAETIGRRGIQGAPDLVVEILSKSTARRDRGVKREVCERSGVREYWVIDPEALTAELHRLDPEAARFRPPVARSAARGEALGTPLLPGFELPLADLAGPRPAGAG